MTDHPIESVALRPDPQFALCAEGPLGLPPGVDAQAAWRLSTTRLSRDRLDLESAVRRVLLSAEADLADRADGAMIDLCLSAGAPGVDLSRHLFEQVQHRLSEPTRLALAGWLARAGDPADPELRALPLVAGRVLGADVVGRQDLVARERADQAAETPLQQAIALIDEGQFEPARALLEQSLLEQPDDAAVQAELLGLYRSLRDDTGLKALQVRLLDRHGRLPTGWPLADAT